MKCQAYSFEYANDKTRNCRWHLNISVWINHLKNQELEINSEKSRLFRAFSPYLFRRDEEGSFTIFSLFIFLMILFICGLGVDLMRFETERTRLQGAIDSAALAAANLRSESDATALAKDFMVRAGYDSNLVSVEVEEKAVGDASENARSREVSVLYDLSINPFFIDLIGIDYLKTTAVGSAQQSSQDLEISLVLDMSSSMGDGNKMQNLKDAANLFVDSIIVDLPSGPQPNISIVPYNQTVAAPRNLLDMFNTRWQVQVPPEMVAQYNGGTNSVTSYPFNAEGSTCVRFPGEIMITSNLESDVGVLRSIPRFQPLEMLAYYSNSPLPGEDRHNRPADSFNRNCNPEQILLPWSTSREELNQRIDSLQPYGTTATDVGLKWGLALLDPSMRDVVNNLVSSGELSNTVLDHPLDYDPASALKIVVLMTDGRNTNQHDLATPVKRGPSPVWHSELASRDFKDLNGDGIDEDISDLYAVDSNNDGVADRRKSFFYGLYVEDPEQPESTRFLRSNSPDDFSDGVRVSVADLPTDARQLEWTEVFDRFTVDVASVLFLDSAPGPHTAGMLEQANLVGDAEQNIVQGSLANRRMVGGSVESGLCDAAKHDNDVIIYTIAFEAGPTARDIMKKCASSPSHYFNASNGAELKEAFSSIASSITRLRLTQ